MTRRPIWFEIYAEDIERAREFYGQVFGWRLEPFDDYDPENYFLLKDQRHQSVAGAIVRAGSVTGLESRGSGSSVVYLEVDDLETTASAAIAAGGQVVSPRREISSDAGSFLIIADPEGTPLGLWCP